MLEHFNLYVMIFVFVFHFINSRKTHSPKDRPLCISYYCFGMLPDVFADYYFFICVNNEIVCMFLYVCTLKKKVEELFL